jgi:hypothetical protein
MSFMSFMMWQLVTTAALWMWYAKRHPEDAKRMKMSFMQMFSR